MAVLDGFKLASEYIQQIPQMSQFFEEMVRAENLSLVDLGLLDRMRETGKQYVETLLVGGMLPDKKQARATAERLTDYYKSHGYPIDLFEAQENLKLNVKHSTGDEWKAIKALRDEFNQFVDKVGVIPGAIVTTAIESARRREWRYVFLSQAQKPAPVTQK